MPRSSPVRCVALLRGINVGGNNLIRMVDLRAAFVDLGFTDVETYIQSGNVVFTVPGAVRGVAARIEAALAAAFAYDARVVVITADELAAVVAGAPAGFGAAPTEYKYDVLFVRPPTTPGEVLAAVAPKPGVDTAAAGAHAVYFSRLASKASQSRLTKIVGTPVYKSVTIRNWNTTTKLLALSCSEARSEA